MVWFNSVDIRLVGFLVCWFVLSKIAGCIKSRQNAAPVSANSQGRKPEAVLTSAGASIPKEALGGIRLVVSAKENCLVFVKADGKVVFHRVLEKGRSNNWKAKDRIELSLGNASAVEIIVNGQRFKDLGRRGQPLKNIVITEKEGLSIPR